MARMHFSPLVLAAALGACAVPTAIDCLDQTCPPPELGRPLWVRVCAGTGAWIGGIAGGVASIVLLPITWPLSELAEDGLGEFGQSEFLLFPAMVGASIGHAALGSPPDVVDYLFRRVWQREPEVLGYDFVPVPGIALPRAEPLPAAPQQSATPAPAPAPAPEKVPEKVDGAKD